ncbi:hypothetical protein [Koleobacter methoxysyntrophicus]|nr:hypothetical protein [Koleobacter methoxysyntrophicus]
MKICTPKRCLAIATALETALAMAIQQRIAAFNPSGSGRKGSQRVRVDS